MSRTRTAAKNKTIWKWEIQRVDFNELLVPVGVGIEVVRGVRRGLSYKQ